MALLEEEINPTIGYWVRHRRARWARRMGHRLWLACFSSMCPWYQVLGSEWTDAEKLVARLIEPR